MCRATHILQYLKGMINDDSKKEKYKILQGKNSLNLTNEYKGGGRVKGNFKALRLRGLNELGHFCS